MAWYRVVFWEGDGCRREDVLAFVEDYCRQFRAAGLRIPAAFKRHSQSAWTFFLDPLAAAFYFGAPGRSRHATELLREGRAKPCADPPDLGACQPVTCVAAT
jgi:hypothetical protein